MTTRPPRPPRSAPRAPASVEPLEARRLLAADAVTAELSPGGKLRVWGTDGNDSIVIYPTAIDGAPVAMVRVGQATAAFPAAAVRMVRVDAGAGNDSVSVSFEAPTKVMLGPGNDLIDAESLAAPARLFGGDGDDFIFGSYGPDYIDGGAGDDHLEGNDGRDTLVGRGGADTFYGGPGFDVVGYAERTAGVTVTAGQSAPGAGGLPDDGEPGEGDNVQFDVEGIIGGAGDDHLSAAGGNRSLLFGGPGNDTLTGGAADDWLAGGDGDDVMDGGAGDDGFWGQAGVDTVTYAGRTDRVWAAIGRRDANGAVTAGGRVVERDDIRNDVEVLVGTDHDDQLSASAATGRAVRIVGGGGSDRLSAWGNDTLDGGVGNDRLYAYLGGNLLLGGPGDDHLGTHPGRDTLDGGGGRDALNYSDRPDAMVIDLVGTHNGGTPGGGSAGDPGDGDTYLSPFASVLAGRGDDTVYGSSAAEWIDGFEGDDVLHDGGGVDTVFGGPGDDRFVAAADGLRDVFEGEDGTDVYDRDGIEAVAANDVRGVETVLP